MQAKAAGSENALQVSEQLFEAVQAGDMEQALNLCSSLGLLQVCTATLTTVITGASCASRIVSETLQLAFCRNRACSSC